MNNNVMIENVDVCVEDGDYAFWTKRYVDSRYLEKINLPNITMILFDIPVENYIIEKSRRQVFGTEIDAIPEFLRRNYEKH